jgi:hypothetical protein
LSKAAREDPRCLPRAKSRLETALAFAPIQNAPRGSAPSPSKGNPFSTRVLDREGQDDNEPVRALFLGVCHPLLSTQRGAAGVDLLWPRVSSWGGRAVTDTAVTARVESRMSRGIRPWASLENTHRGPPWTPCGMRQAHEQAESAGCPSAPFGVHRQDVCLGEHRGCHPLL